MSDFPAYALPVPPILTPWHPEAVGHGANVAYNAALGSLTSATWPSNNGAYFYPFTLTGWGTAYQLLFWVGATSSGNIDVGIYDAQFNRLVSSGSTAMSATVNTVQELNITDTVLPPGGYYLAAACSTTAGTIFKAVTNDELALSSLATYNQASALPLPDPASPAVSTEGTPMIPAIGIQFRSVF